MPQAGMVHALHQIHQLLKPDGFLIDIHPTNELATLEVRVDQQITPAGWIYEWDDYIEYEWADSALQRALNVQWFELERSGVFNFVWYADSMAELRNYLAEEWHDALIDEVTFMRAHEALSTAAHNKEAIVREAIKIARYRKR